MWSEVRFLRAALVGLALLTAAGLVVLSSGVGKEKRSPLIGMEDAPTSTPSLSGIEHPLPTESLTTQRESVLVTESAGAGGGEKPIPMGALSANVFPKRGRRMELPASLPNASALLADSVLNPDQREATESELVELNAILHRLRGEIEVVRNALLLERHSWMLEKVRVFGEGIPSGTAEAKILAQAPRHEDCVVGTVAVASSSGPVVVRIDFGEYAPLDIAYDDLWAKEGQALDEIAAFFAKNGFL